MIDLKDMQREVRQGVKSMEVNEFLKFSSFKKDRSVIMVRLEDGFMIEEDGFEKKTWIHLSDKEAVKIMKKLQVFEFPRSSKLWRHTGRVE